MRRALVVAALFIGLLLVGAGPTSAQSRAPAGRFEVGVGVAWQGQSALGTGDAVETTPTGSTSRLFSTSSTLMSAPGVDLRVGVRVWRELEAQAFSTYAKPTLETKIQNDLESLTPVTATETVRQYTIGGGALWYLPYGRSAQKLRLFVSGSAAYLRQLHNSDTLAVTGRTYELGVGAKYLLASRRKGVRTVGVRADARIAASTKGVGFEDRTRYAPVLGASLFVRF